MTRDIQPVKVVVKKDYLGNDLTIGSKVVFMEVRYRNFLTGTIVSMGEKGGSVVTEEGKKFKQMFKQMIRYPRS